MTTREIFAQRVTELRKEKKINQAQLADRLGISRTSVNLYESAARVPDIQVLARYAEFFGVTTDYLLGLSDHKLEEFAVAENELGLEDRATEKLYNYMTYSNFVAFCKKSRVPSVNTNPFEADLPEELFSRVKKRKYLLNLGIDFGNSTDEMETNISHLSHGLNDVICEPELLVLLGKYWRDTGSLYFDREDGLTPEVRSKILCLQIQEKLMQIHDRIKNQEQEDTNAEENKRQE